MKVAIVGAGITGLTLAYLLNRRGHEVVLYEAGGAPGGELATVEVGSEPIERFYHHLFTHDRFMIELCRELGIEDRLQWHEPEMGFYAGGRVSFTEYSRHAAARTDNATVFAYHVKDPERYGVVTFDRSGRVSSIEEKPSKPKSNYAVTGLYFYPGDVTTLVKQIELSARGELEITDLNRLYLSQGRLKVEVLGRGVAWLDTGTHESLLQASTFIETIQTRQSVIVACPEEVAYRLSFINAEQLMRLAEPMRKTSYGQHLLNILDHPVYWLEMTPR